MKKNIQWLKAEVEKQDIVMDKGYIYTNDLIYLINQLDEPEVLSQEWIDRFEQFRAYVQEQRDLSYGVELGATGGYTGRIANQYDGLLEMIEEFEEHNPIALQNLLVPTLSEMETDERTQLETAYKDILERGEFWFDAKEYKVIPKQELPVIPKHILEFIIRAFDVETTPNTIETLSGMTTDRFLEVIKDSKLVPKQKLPVIPKYVAEWIEDYIEKGFDLYRTLNVLESGASNLVKIYRWYRNNTLEFTTAYLTKEYKVDEIRYHVRVPYSKLHYYFIDNGCTGAAGLFGVDENHSDFELTEDEINEYLPGISKEYWEEIK